MDKIPEVRKGSGQPPQAIIEVILIDPSGLGLKRNPDTSICIAHGFLRIVFGDHRTDVSWWILIYIAGRDDANIAKIGFSL